ncbi:MAG: amidohydrolase family protein [bacterium]|nr:amidohydrolase family protein [bacterium]
MTIDVHQHYWRYNAREYGWIGESMAALRRDFTPGDLKPLLDETGVEATVAVQARQTLEETDWLLTLADENAWIAGVVGWADLRGADLDAQLERLAAHPKLKGVRHVVHDEPDDRFLMRDDFMRGVSRLKTYDLTYDLLLFERHLPVAIEFVRRLPEQTFVLDHISKPRIRESVLSPWAENLHEIARYGNVSCKVSGMVTEADWRNWTPETLRPYLDVVFDAFGAERIMLGSDWPVCTVAGTYHDVMNIGLEYIKALSESEQAAIKILNAKRIYRLG